MNLRFDNNKIVSGAADDSLRIWDMHSGECIQILQVSSPLPHHHHAPLLPSVNPEAHRACCVVRVVSVVSVVFVCLCVCVFVLCCVNTRQGHTEMVTSLKFDASKIVSGSADRTCIVWDFLRGRPEDRGFSFFGY